MIHASREDDNNEPTETQMTYDSSITNFLNDCNVSQRMLEEKLKKGRDFLAFANSGMLPYGESVTWLIVTQFDSFSHKDWTDEGYLAFAECIENVRSKEIKGGPFLNWLRSHLDGITFGRGGECWSVEQTFPAALLLMRRVRFTNETFKKGEEFAKAIKSIDGSDRKPLPKGTLVKLVCEFFATLDCCMSFEEVNQK